MPPRPNSQESPFATPTESAPTIRLWMLFVSMTVIAGCALLLAFAARIPSFSNGIRDLFGVSNGQAASENSRSAHLFLLLLCYCSPLLMMIWISTLRSFIQFQQRRLDRRLRQEYEDEKEFTMES
ncbi:MAG: hypothetical protein LW850_14910 [Planctomycetaceae bacterium]|nr:hypothetical protein [Planctomycetaceae bacterium]